MIQTVIVTLAVILAAAYLAQRWLGLFRKGSKSSSCGGCNQCAPEAKRSAR